METYLINGGNSLNGEVEISGAKNSVLGLIAAAIMTDDNVILENVPNVTDVNYLLEAIKNIGGSIDYKNNTYN